jgi:branched-chain amino acid aminotransferase
MAGSQDYEADPRNAEVRVYLNGALVPRGEAKISVFDAGFALGDGVWEGLRLHKGALLFLDAHLDRLLEGARRIRLDIGMDKHALTAAMVQTLEANGMTDGAHLRLMVTRGLKATVNQDPRNALGAPTVVIAAEFKAPPASAPRGLHIATASIRCSPAHMFDMRLNSHSRLNLITALLEVIDAGADEALMLDPNGFVSSCNATNAFFVRDGAVWTSTGAYCFNGITRGNIVELCKAACIPLHQADFTLDHAHAADEAFLTGTLGGILPVRQIDTAKLPACPGPVTLRLLSLYGHLKDSYAERHRLVGA